MDPYRAPQHPPSAPHDAMRSVLIGVGVIAALITVAAIAVGVMDRRDRSVESPAPPPPTRTAPPKETLQVASVDESPHAPRSPNKLGPEDDPEPPPRGITRGIVVDGAVHGDVGPHFSSNPFDFTFAIFPADDTSAPATAILKTIGGHGERVVPIGRYDLCWSRHYPREPYPRSRADWEAGCQRVVVTPLTHVSAGVGNAGPSRIFFQCSPSYACPK